MRSFSNRYAILVLALMVSAWTLSSTLNRSTSTNTALTSFDRIAVSPFQLTGGEGEPYWLHGFAETLISRLASRQDLQVVSSAGSGRELEDAASLIRELDVDALVLGSVQQDQQRLRINIRIVSAQGTQTHLADVIDGNLDHLFALQDDVANRLLRVLRPITANTPAAPRQIDEAAWQHFLLGRFHWSKRNPRNLDLAIDYFKRAIAEDPEFALGYVGLCNSYHFQYLYVDWPLYKALSLCQPLLDTALALDSELGQVHASLGLLAQSRDQDGKARHHLQKAIELAPNYAPGWMWYGSYLRRHGEINQALEYHRTALKLDPLSPIATRNLAVSLLASGIANEARDTYARALELEPDYTNRPLDEIDFLPLTVDRASAFLDWSERFDDRYLANTVSRLAKAQIHLSLGRVEAAEQELSSIPVDFQTHPYFLYTEGLVDLALGNNEAALMKFTQRMHLESLNRQRVMPVVGVLQYLGRQQQARALFLDAYPEFNQSENVPLSANNAWLFGIFTHITELGSEQAQVINDKIRSYVENTVEDGWLAVWLLTLIGDLDKASDKFQRLLKSGWLPNHQEMLFPIEQDPAYAALRSHKNGARIEQLLENNRLETMSGYLKLQRLRSSR